MLQVEKWLKDGLDNLQDILLENEKEWNQYFQASSELNQNTRTISYLNVSEEERASVSFSVLRENFEAGLLLKRNGEKWQVIEQFCYGEKEEAPNYNMTLPNCQINQVLRVHPRGFQSIEELNLPYFSQEANALLFKPCEDYAFILFSEFPKVILRYLSDEVHEFLLKAFVYR